MPRGGHILAIVVNSLTFFLLGYFSRGLIDSWIQSKSHPQFENTRKKEETRIEKGIRVEVLNATEVRGLSRAVTIYLRKLGFDVVYYGTYHTQPLEHTVIIERKDPNMSNANLFREKFGIPFVDRELDYYRPVDVTIVLGKDFDKFFSKALSIENILY